MTPLPKPTKFLTHCEVEAILLGIDLDWTVRRVALAGDGVVQSEAYENPALPVGAGRDNSEEPNPDFSGGFCETDL